MTNPRSRAGVYPGIAGAVLALWLGAAPSSAQDFTVPSGATVGQQNMFDPGDTGVIEPGGTVSTAGFNEDGVAMRDDDQTVTNGGLVTTTGDASFGISSTGDNARIDNTGAIRTTGNNSFAISISAGSDNARIDNTGSIATTGTNAHGIVSQGVDARIRNCGSIHVSGTNAHAIFSQFAGGQVTNCGTIISEQTAAIRFIGAADNVLTLLPGSVIEGDILFGGGTDTLNVASGLSIANTFDKVPEIINSNGAPFAVSGNQVAVVDPTNLSMQDEMVFDLTGGVFSAVQGGGNGTANVSALSFAAYAPPGARFTKSDAPADRWRPRFWADGFGSLRRQGARSPTVEADLRLGGVVSGLDLVNSPALRAGFFGGGAWSSVESDFASQTTDTQSVFAGAYASAPMGPGQWDFVVTAGHTGNDRTRRVANNLAPGGIEIASAEYDGWFIAPTLGLTVPAGPTPLEARFQGGYAGLFLDGFSETGATDALTVAGRDLHLIHGRFALALPDEWRHANDATTRLTIEVGVEGRAQFGDDAVSATLLGQSVTFDPGGEKAVAGGFAGLTGEHMTPGGAVLYGSIEGKIETDGGQQLSGRAGVRLPL